MNIVIRISHPAHVHKFRHLIRLLSIKNSVFVVAIEKEMTTYLLKKFEIDYYLVGKNRKGLIAKILELFIQEFKLFFKLRKFKPDIFIGGGDPLLAHVSVLYQKPYIAFEDTESASLILKSYKRIASFILTPQSYFINLGVKQIRYRGFHELAYLNPQYFKPNNEVLKHLALLPAERFAIFRFVSWDASHDIGVSGLTYSQKIKLLEEISGFIKVFVTSESELPPAIRKYMINIPPELMHDALFFSDIYIGEGATMASECAILGTPAIYTNPLYAGIINEESDAGLLYHLTDFDTILFKAKEIAGDPLFKIKCQKKAQLFNNSKINVI